MSKTPKQPNRPFHSIDYHTGTRLGYFKKTKSKTWLRESKLTRLLFSAQSIILTYSPHGVSVHQEKWWLSFLCGNKFSCTKCSFLERRWFVHGTESEGGDDCVMKACFQLRNQLLHSWVSPATSHIAEVFLYINRKRGIYEPTRLWGVGY